MWVVYAFSSAFFAALTTILAKLGVSKVDSTVATALRTVVILIFAWLVVFMVGSEAQIGTLSTKTWLFLILSGFATGASWLFYFKALQLGDVNKVTPVDKSSVVLTIVLAVLFLGESLGAAKVFGVLMIAAGTYLMLELKKGSTREAKNGNAWLLYAVLSAVFAALVAILGKIGIEGVESNLGTALRTVVVLLMSWSMVAVAGKKGADLMRVDKRSMTFIIFSGVAAGLSWLCYFRALQEGPASVVVPIDKLSIVFTVLFSYFALHEKLSRKSSAGLVIIVAGTLLLLV